MSNACRLAILLALILSQAPSPAWCQTSALAGDASGERNAEGSSPSPALSPEDRAPAVTELPAETQRFLRQVKVDITWLPGGRSNGLQITDIESSATLGVPLVEGWAPLLLTPYAAAHFWEGPKGPGAIATPDLPPNLYDLNVEIGWRPRLARWLFADLAVTPGVYSDFKDVNADSFQMRGRGLAIVAFSPECQVVAGGMYVNRNKTKFLPAGGVIWNPNEDTRCFLVFPQPKVSHRLATVGTTPLWGYVAGEFGGGRWSVERANGAIDSLDYTDLRVTLGLESVVAHGWKGHVEVGYVFGRRVNFSSDTPDVKPPDTVMLRAGFSY
jgi:hypothetical protein